MNGDNYGMQQSGGTLNAGSLAIGDHARAIAGQLTASSQTAEGAQAAHALQAVIDRLDQDGTSLPARDKAYELAAQLGNEVLKPKPDGFRLSGLLKGLTDTVSSASSIAASVVSLTASLSHLLP